MTVHRWQVRFEVTPHADKNGQEADPAAAGARHQSFYIRAKRKSAAKRLADCIGFGLLADPTVWCATIISIRKRS